MSLLGPVITLLLLTQAPPSHEERLDSGQRFRLESEHQAYDSERGLFTADGKAVLRTEGLVLRADHLVYDQKAQRAEATGNVMLVGELGAALAEHVTLDLTTQTAVLDEAVYLQKEGISPEALAAVESPEQLRTAGITTLSLRAGELQRTGPRAVRVRRLSFTPCDCDPSRPSWRIQATSAHVEAGERASLWWPVVYVRDVPVLALPYLNLPLSSRRTGLLIPKPGSMAQNGFYVDLPFFLTLGPSYDLTFTPSYLFGTQDVFGVRGPRLHTEFRYAPSATTRGRIGLGLLYDLRNERDPFAPWIQLPGTRRGLRGDVRLTHASEWWGWRQRADLSVASDSYLPRDFSTDVIASQTGYLRSTASVSRALPNTYLGAHAVLRQDLRYGFGLFGEDFRIESTGDPNVAATEPSWRPSGGDPEVWYRQGVEAGGPRTMQELPSLHYFVPETRVAGPLWSGVHASYTRISPLAGLHADEGPDGFWFHDWSTADAFQSDGIFQARNEAGGVGESEARDRFSARVSAALPFQVGVLHLRPYAASRGDIWVGELTGDVHSRVYPLGGLELSSELSRIYGDATSGIRHSVTPRLEVRSVPGAVGRGVERPYDAIDAAVPLAGFTDAVASIRQGLWLKRGGSLSSFVLLEVGQGADVEAGRLADAFARLQLGAGSLRLEGATRYDVELQRLALLTSRIGWWGPRGFSIEAGYDNLLTSGSDLQRRSLERLVGTLALPDAERAQLITFAIGSQLGWGFSARYDVQLQPGARSRVSDVLIDISPFVNQGLTVSYTPNCNCFALVGTARLLRVLEADPDNNLALPKSRLRPDFGITLSVSGFGSFGPTGAGL